MRERGNERGAVGGAAGGRSVVVATRGIPLYAHARPSWWGYSTDGASILFFLPATRGNCLLVVVVALEGRAWITRAHCPVSLSWCVCLFIVAFWEIPDASNGLWRAEPSIPIPALHPVGSPSVSSEERLPQSSSSPSSAPPLSILFLPFRPSRPLVLARPFKVSFHVYSSRS